MLGNKYLRKEMEVLAGAKFNACRKKEEVLKCYSNIR